MMTIIELMDNYEIYNKLYDLANEGDIDAISMLDLFINYNGMQILDSEFFDFVKGEGYNL